MASASIKKKGIKKSKEGHAPSFDEYIGKLKNDTYLYCVNDIMILGNFSKPQIEETEIL